MKSAYESPMEMAVDLISGKYKSTILWYLSVKPTLRFSEISRLIPRAPHKVLTQQLRQLEGSELITRHVYPEVPPRVEYRITGDGRELIPILEAFARIGRTRDTRQRLGAAEALPEPRRERALATRS